MSKFDGRTNGREKSKTVKKKKSIISTRNEKGKYEQYKFLLRFHSNSCVSSPNASFIFTRYRDTLTYANRKEPSY